MHAAVQFPSTPKAVRAAPLKLARRMSAEQAFERIVRSCLDQIRANEEGVARFHDVESLHQMRVGLRRLRAALAMFKDLLQLPDNLESELDWFVGELGPARDWDVLLESTLPRVEQAMAGEGALPDVRQAVQQTVQALHEQAGAAVASARYARLVHALESWLDKRAWRDTLSAGRKARLKMRVGEFATAILEQDQQRLLKRGRKLKEGGTVERHRMRIAAKRSRYATEFFASLYPGRQVRPYVAALATLQDELGSMNDAAVADRLLAELAQRYDGVDADAGFIRGYLASGAADGMVKVCKLWKKLRPMRAPH
jgi:CHAD domain-containing protein